MIRVHFEDIRILASRQSRSDILYIPQRFCHSFCNYRNDRLERYYLSSLFLRVLSVSCDLFLGCLNLHGNKNISTHTFPVCRANLLARNSLRLLSLFFCALYLRLATSPCCSFYNCVDRQVISRDALYNSQDYIFCSTQSFCLFCSSLFPALCKHYLALLSALFLALHVFSYSLRRFCISSYSIFCKTLYRNAQLFRCKLHKLLYSWNVSYPLLTCVYYNTGGV